MASINNNWRSIAAAFLIICVCEYVTCNERKKKSEGKCLPTTESNRWLLGETIIGGLCNQLFGVYSIIPMARLLHADGVVVGPMHSRFDNYEVDYKEVQKRHRAVPFSSFFDWQHLKRFWAARNLTLLEWHVVPNHCLSPGPNIEMVKFKRPRFYSFSDAEIAQMAAKSGHPLPLPSPGGPEARQLVSVESEWKMQAFYNNWQSPQHLERLLEFHQSLRPSALLRHLVHRILAALPTHFWAAHIRLEGDAVLMQKNDQGFDAALPQHMQRIQTSHCIMRHGNLTSSRLPALFVASGLFQSAAADGGSGFSSRRLSRVLEQLHSMGFEPHNVFSRSGLLTASNLTLVERRGNLTEETEEDITIKKLTPDQWALVDLEVCKAASCFIPSHFSSSFSYTINRHRQMAKGMLLERDRLDVPTNEFTIWGY
eukprot:gene28025-36907_t